jgi:hypothetical protein
MKNSKFLKGLVMFAIGAIVPYMQVTPIDWSLVVVIAILSCGNYAVKNAFDELKSKSKRWSLDFINIFELVNVCQNLIICRCI